MAIYPHLLENPTINSGNILECDIQNKIFLLQLKWKKSKI